MLAVGGKNKAMFPLLVRNNGLGKSRKSVACVVTRMHVDAVGDGGEMS